MSGDAASILNTGLPELSAVGRPNSYALGGQQIAVQFEIDQSTRIDSIEAYFYRRRSDHRAGEQTGLAQVAIFDNLPTGEPGEQLYAQSFFVPADGAYGADWHGAFDLNWSLNTGSYWVAFGDVPDGDFSGGMPYSIRLTQPTASRDTNDGGSDNWRTGDSQQVGVRISGQSIQQADLPEPTSSLTWLLSTIIMLRSVIGRRRRCVV